MLRYKMFISAISNQSATKLYALLVTLQLGGTLAALIGRQEAQQLDAMLANNVLDYAEQYQAELQAQQLQQQQEAAATPRCGFWRLLFGANCNEEPPTPPTPPSNNERRLMAHLAKVSAVHERPHQGSRSGARSYGSGKQPGAYMKQFAAKKNIQYMIPCHFKICHMGQKRMPSKEDGDEYD